MENKNNVKKKQTNSKQIKRKEKKIVEKPRIEKVETMEKKPEVVETVKTIKKETENVQTTVNNCCKKIKKLSLKQIIILSIVALILLIETIFVLHQSIFISKHKDFVKYGDLLVGDKYKEIGRKIESYKKTIKKFKKLNLQSLAKEYKSKNIKIILFGREGCPHCHNFTTTLDKSLKEYKYEVLYFDTDTIDSEETYRELIKIDTKTFENLGTPLLIGVKNGKVISTLEGERDYNTLVRFLKELGIKKK